MIQNKWFKRVTIEEYYKKLYDGEKEFGRFLIIEETENKRFKMTFARFLNKEKNKIIGYELEGREKTLFPIFL